MEIDHRLVGVYLRQPKMMMRMMVKLLYGDYLVFPFLNLFRILIVICIEKYLSLIY